METEEKLQFREDVVAIPILLILFIWGVYWVEIKFNYNFNKFGVYPNSLKGLRGVLFSPFIHSDTKHLFNNSIPLFLFTSSVLYFYRDVAFKVLMYGSLLTGFITWLIARESHHIGASGVVYLLFGFILFSGLFKRHYRLVTMSLIVVLLYGSMIWYIFPVKEGMSWEGHLSGLISGLLFAFLYRKKGLVKEKHNFSKTDFDDMFDEQGNYNPPIIEEEVIESDKITSNFESIKINYIYKSSEEE